jgi:hypothetical protein
MGMFATITKITNTAGKSTVTLSSGGTTFNLTGKVSDTTGLAVGAIVKILLKQEPAVNGVSPNMGPSAGGTAVTLTGVGFTGATAVTFGSVAATSVTVVSDTEITCTAPAQAEGAAIVIVTTPTGSSPASRHFQYQNVPTVTAVSPTGGTVAGGTAVKITGTDFTGVTAVKFGTVAATGVSVVSATEIICASPAGSGMVHITIVTDAGTSATSSTDEFTYS